MTHIRKNWQTKNAAIVTLRTKQIELRRLHTLESILAAFLNAETQIFSIIQKAVTTHCISLKTILQGTARVPTTGEEIHKSVGQAKSLWYRLSHARTFS
jgi:hypothetical protein